MKQTVSGATPTVVAAPALVVESIEPSEPAKVGDKNIAPNTTAADDLRTEAQRWTSKLWELVQAYISCAVITIALLVNARVAWMIIVGGVTESQIAAANSANQNINILASLIIGFYFGRTNHQKEAGVQKGDIGR